MTEPTSIPTPKWNITLLVSRQKDGQARHFDSIRMDVDPDEYVLDAVERTWAFHDRSITFRHACHHSTCGACGMVVNGAEKLTCITPIREVTQDGGTLKIEPLRNFPVISDLVVDMGELYRRMDMVGHHSVNSDRREAIQPDFRPAGPAETGEDFIRLSDCIECGTCNKVCPMETTPGKKDFGVSDDRAEECISCLECRKKCPTAAVRIWG